MSGDLKAGGYLDALIGEQVFGIAQDPHGEAVEVPPYSTDIGAAWQIVEHLTSNGSDTFRCQNYDDGTWDAWFHIYDMRCKGYAHADTAPLAICKAALEFCKP